MVEKKSVKKPAVPTLRVMRSHPVPTAPAPPSELGPTGLSLWRDILAAYEFGDRASIETLAQCCHAADRAARCRRQIDEDGELIRGRGGMREHPLLRTEIQNRAFLVRTLAKLGLDLEPTHPTPGRPAGQRGG
jgi:hypothetical protein